MTPRPLALDLARQLRAIARPLRLPGTVEQVADRRADAIDVVAEVRRLLPLLDDPDRFDVAAVCDYVGAAVAGSLTRPTLLRVATEAQARLWQRHAPVTAGGDDA
jgi:hypothetical protein